MSIQKWLLFLFLHIHLHGLILAQLPDLAYTQCGDNGNYTENSTYQNNLNSLLSSLSSKIDKNGFYNASIGQDSDMASAIVLCRGDVELEECRSCVNNISRKLVQSCLDKIEAFGGYDGCTLQYSNRSIIDTPSFSTLFYMWNPGNASKPEGFNQDLFKLLDSLRGIAADGGPLRKYASGNATGPDFQTIYALVQCTPDLSPRNCFDCLTEAYGNMPICPCNGKKGGRIIGARCNFRYESYRFFEDVPLEAPPPAGNDNKTVPIERDDKTAPTGKDDKTARTVIIIVVPTVTTVILIGCISVILLRRRKRKLVDEVQSIRGDDISTTESLQYEFSTIRAATDNFSNANKLGQGGFGPVYKGKLPNGQEVAVKRLSADSGQGDLEFKNEVLLVARLQHRNLVSGYMSPEYAMYGQFSVKSDVFSFGVLVLEILSGQKNTCFRNGESVEDLLSYAWTNWCEGTATNLIDPMLRGSSGLVRDIMRCIHIALLCVQENIADRPTMAAVVLMLSSLSLSLPVPSGPAYYTHSDISPEISLIQEYNSRQSEPRELAKNDTNELLYLLVDAINSGLRDANGSLSKQNVERVILPRINAKIRFPKTYNPIAKTFTGSDEVWKDYLKIVFGGVTANGNGSIALGADDTDATTYGEENRDFGMEDFLYDPNNDAFIAPNHYEPSYQPPSPHQCSQPSHSPLGSEVPTEKSSRNKRSRSKYEGSSNSVGPIIKPKF
ncbi:hypothetical protein RND71_033373 [Anisodus tanguticus]|uniref:Cysteine-rich receptor-like protein kinase 29 n=1 Tax=Anisodus tanguticus TaxID=243964 RepID=A0AAE1V369_9SOLA|nr:hypothetical protein RND71_033373 [Anisodus tanguticus]